MKLAPPCAYQGGKQAFASQIIDIIAPQPNDIFYDLCCGSGAISIELINRGHDKSKIHMIDAGPWGLVWKMVGNGTFKTDKFQRMCDNIPEDRDLIQPYIKALSKRPAQLDTPYIFLILQANSFGGKAIWVGREGEEYIWKNSSFRSHWKPTATSNRRSPVLPMHPEPHIFGPKMKFVCEQMVGVKGEIADVHNIEPEENAIIYVDPPYEELTPYGKAFNILEFVKQLKKPCYVSEAKPLDGAAETYLISKGRKKGGVSGDRKKLNEEWLSFFKPN